MKKLTTLLSILALGLTSYAQTDVTYRITNPDFEINGAEGWTNTDMSPQSNSAFTKKHGTVYMEKWTGKGGKVGDALLKQTVSNMPKGKYRLTVAAQNIQQDTPTAEQTGVYIYGKSTTNKTVVTTTGDYSVDIQYSIGTSSTAYTGIQIGFQATNATGNYICCDNFRLEFLSIEPAAVDTLISNASGQLERKLNDVHRNALVAAIEAAKKALEDKLEDLTGVTMTLSDSYIAAQANTKAYTNLNSLNSKAKLLQGKKMNVKVEEALNAAIAAADNSKVTTDNDPVALTEALQAAYDAATISVASYEKLNTTITKAEEFYDETKKGAAEFGAVIAEAKTTYENATANDDEVADMVAKLTKAQMDFRLANGEKGDGKEPKVTYTNPYVLTGSTEAIMRFDFEGDNLIEKGVCWSTSPNPEISDNRTTKSFSLNGTMIHVKGLETATVYYLRPYVLNKTYWVAYGDVVKVVTHPKGTCKGTWDEGAPTEAANTRCRNAINETIEYFNQWTGIMGFTLSGHYGASTPTADCSYGGWMRIGPNAGNQAIGTVIHETGHGVGVGTSSRWWDSNVHSWKWYGREANQIYSFLENKEADPYTSDFCMVGDNTHGWGSSASYDWFVNGADKDKHSELQYLGGCALLYGLFIDGLCPTNGYANGLAGYTYNYDEGKKYYLMNKDADRGLNTGLLYQRSETALGWKPMLEDNTTSVTDSAAWMIEYNANTGYYYFKNAATGKYMSHSGSNVTAKNTTKVSDNEKFQLMPDRTNVQIGKDGEVKTHGYWFTWENGGSKAMGANTVSSTTGYGAIPVSTFDYADKTSPKQQWIILSEDEMRKIYGLDIEPTAIEEVTVNVENTSTVQVGFYNISGARIPNLQKGINIIRYADGSSKKVIMK